MARRTISVNEALALIFDDAMEGDLEELSDEDQPCSATESEEQDSVVDNNGPPSPRQCRLATAEGQEVAEIVVQTLQRMCTDECFHGFWQRVAKQAEDLHLPEAQLPQRRKVPRRFGVGDAEPEHPATPYDYFK